MSKRKNGSGDDLPLGDHSSYMPQMMLVLADVRLKVKGGAVLPAHALKLVETCGAIAGSSELFAGATPDRPAALSSPFDEFEEADVARFLKCIYTATGNALQAEDACVAAVVRLAHALDAAPVLAAAQRHTLKALRRHPTYRKIVEANELAALCGWDDVRNAGLVSLVTGLQTPTGTMETPANVALSDINAFDLTDNLIQACPPELAALAFGTLAANYRRLYSTLPQVLGFSPMSTWEAVAASRAAVDGVALESRCGRFVAAIDVPEAWNDETDRLAPFKSHGLEWQLDFRPNGDMLDGRPCVVLELLSGWPKKVRYQAGLVNWREALREVSMGSEDVFTEDDRWGKNLAIGDLTLEDFRDPAAGWVNFHGHAAPFVRILEVSDPTPDEIERANGED
jgi:hypothetical protein